MTPSRAVLAVATGVALASPLTKEPAYLVGIAPGVRIAPLVTVGDSFNLKPSGLPYRMVGTPDGLGVLPNGDGTFTVLVNHELLPVQGIPREHSTTGAGAFVSRWTIRDGFGPPGRYLRVVEGRDLANQVSTWNVAAGTHDPPAKGAVFCRFCSGDFPAATAFFDGSSGLGTTARVFLSAEECGTLGRAFGHVVDGPEAGTSYQLPHFGMANFENQVAYPAPGTATIVVGLDDSMPGQVYVYRGTKRSTGSEVERAGLVGGMLYGVRVAGVLVEDRLAGIPSGTPFDLAPLGDVSGIDGAALEAASDAAGVTEFLRPEDGAWDPSSPHDFCFATTDQYDQTKDGVGAQIGRSRLYRLRFDDPATLDTGTIETLLDGTEPHNMLDNLTIDAFGHVLLCEDTGGAAHNGKIWRYGLADDSLALVAMHDPGRFGDLAIAPTPPFTTTEESTGIVDASIALGDGWFLVNVMAHFPIADPELVEGGQLLALFDPACTR